MNVELATITTSGLHRMRTLLRADLLTCYFFNPYSDLYWLFYRDGDFKFPWQMHGPLTHPEQAKRMGSENSPRIEFFDFSEAGKNKEISDEILNGKSFVQREGIQFSIRIRLGRHGRGGSAPHDQLVIVFLSYRDQAAGMEQSQYPENIEQLSEMLAESLFVLSTQPCLLEADSWRLRSLSVRKQRQFSTSLVTRADDPQPQSSDSTRPPRKKSKIEEYWDLITQQARQLLHPQDSDCVVCQLYLVNRDGLLSRLAGDENPEDRAQRFGVCDYVASTGQIILIDDVERYMEKFEERPPDLRSQAPFIWCKLDAKSELACPLIIQGKVIGVLNIESRKENRYQEKDALLMFLYANSVALSLRQWVIFRDLRITSRLQHDVLGANNPEQILKDTYRAANELDYTAGIWLFGADNSESSDWVSGSLFADGRFVRKDGFSQWIFKYCAPVVIADYDLHTQGESPKFSRQIGLLDDAKLFRQWLRPEELLNDTQSPVSLAAVEALQSIKPNTRIGFHAQGRPIVTDFGFPIFADRSGNKVLAVLWAKCNRHFVSVLDEEMWFLSLICRTASEACCVMAERRAASTEKDHLLKLGLLNHHFGDSARQLEKVPLAVVKRDDLLVLHFDIRGFSELTSKCFEAGREDVFQDFTRRFHNDAHRIILDSGGVFDKTVGDGVIGIFNVYSFLLGKDPANPATETRRAIQCALRMLSEFRKLIEDFDNSTKTQFPFLPKIMLGAALAHGRGYVGSTEGHEDLAALEYTVYGDVANRAGKLIDSARVRLIRSWITGKKFAGRIRSDGRLVPVNYKFLATRFKEMCREGVLLVSCPPSFLSDFPGHDCYSINYKGGKERVNWISPMTEP